MPLTPRPLTEKGVRHSTDFVGIHDRRPISNLLLEETLLPLLHVCDVRWFVALSLCMECVLPLAGFVTISGGFTLTTGYFVYSITRTLTYGLLVRYTGGSIAYTHFALVWVFLAICC